MKTVECEKVIAILEWIKKRIPGKNGVLPSKFVCKENVDYIIQKLQELPEKTETRTEQMKESDVLLVGFDHSGGDIAVLIIGRREAGGTTTIINQFQGKEAEELYRKLVEKA